MEAIRYQLVQLVLVLARMPVRIPKVTLNFRHHRTHRCEEGSESHLIAEACIDWLASFGEDQEVLPYLVKLLQAILNLDIGNLRVDVLSFQEYIDWIYLRLARFLLCRLVLSFAQLIDICDWLNRRRIDIVLRRNDLLCD